MAGEKITEVSLESIRLLEVKGRTIAAEPISTYTQVLSESYLLVGDWDFLSVTSALLPVAAVQCWSPAIFQYTFTPLGQEVNLVIVACLKKVTFLYTVVHKNVPLWF